MKKRFRWVVVSKDVACAGLYAREVYVETMERGDVDRGQVAQRRSIGFVWSVFTGMIGDERGSEIKGVAGTMHGAKEVVEIVVKVMREGGQF